MASAGSGGAPPWLNGPRGFAGAGGGALAGRAGSEAGWGAAGEGGQERAGREPAQEAAAVGGGGLRDVICHGGNVGWWGGRYKTDETLAGPRLLLTTQRTHAPPFPLSPDSAE